MNALNEVKSYITYNIQLRTASVSGGSTSSCSQRNKVNVEWLASDRMAVIRN